MGKLDDALVQEFCKAYQINMNYPSDASEDKKKEIDAAFESTHGRKFELWLRTPESVRNYYFGRVPLEVLDAVSRCDENTLRELSVHPDMTKTEIEQYQRDGKYREPVYSDEIIRSTATFTAALAAGYTVAEATELAQNRLFRQSLSEKALAGTLTDEEKEQWRQSRISDRDAILRHKAENEPERVLIYLLNKHRLGEISNDKLMPMLADIIQKIETLERQPELEKLLEKPRYQNMTKLLDEGSREILASIRHKDFPQLNNANIDFKAWEKSDVPADIARFRDAQQLDHSRVQDMNISKQDILNYISNVRQKQKS